MIVLDDGAGTLADIDLLANVADQILGRTLCPLGDFATSSVTSSVNAFREEYERTVTGTANVVVTGVSATSASGTVVVRLNQTVAVTGVSATGSVNNLVTTGDAIVGVQGLYATGQLSGNVFVWGVHLPNQDRGWATIPPTQNPGISGIAPTQDPSWTEITPTQGANWKTGTSD